MNNTESHLSVVYMEENKKQQFPFNLMPRLFCFFYPQCRSESSHSDEESTGEEDEDDPMSLSPASSASFHQPPPPPQTESSAPICLSGSPAQWSVEEVSQFISSLQGWKLWLCFHPFEFYQLKMIFVAHWLLLDQTVKVGSLVSSFCFYHVYSFSVGILRKTQNSAGLCTYVYVWTTSTLTV